MVIKIKVEKIVTMNGEKRIKMQVEGMLRKYQLPDEYTGSAPAVWQESYTDERLFVRSGDCVEQFPLRDTRSSGKPAIEHDPEDVERVISIIQDAGERLHKINQRIDRERAMYAGVSEIAI